MNGPLASSLLWLPMLGILPRLVVVSGSSTTAGTVTRLFTRVTTSFGNFVQIILKGGGDFGAGLFLFQLPVLSPTLFGCAVCFLLLYRPDNCRAALVAIGEFIYLQRQYLSSLLAVLAA